jgi:hypothetical protein
MLSKILTLILFFLALVQGSYGNIQNEPHEEKFSFINMFKNWMYGSSSEGQKSESMKLEQGPPGKIPPGKLPHKPTLAPLVITPPPPPPPPIGSIILQEEEIIGMSLVF